MKDYLNYAGKVCVVTGGSNGMGAALVDMLTDLGAVVYIMDVLPPEKQAGAFIKTDLSNKESINGAFAQLPKKIDKFFGVAGVSALDKEPKFVLSVNFVSNKYMLDELLFDRMAENGAIAFVSSFGGSNWEKYQDELKGLTNASSYEKAVEWIEANEHNFQPRISYTMSKRALCWYASYKSDKYGEKGVRINTVNPGFTQTRLFDDFFSTVGRSEKVMADNTFGGLHRVATPEDQAAALVMINSDLASFVTGNCLMTEGGVQALFKTGVKQAQGIKDGQDRSCFKGPVSVE